MSACPESYPWPIERLASSFAFWRGLRQTQVQSVGMTQDLPMRGGFALTFSIQGRAVAPGDEPSAHYRAVTRDYFQTLAIPPVLGRTFAEREPAPMVVVVDEAFAERHFPEEDPIGRSIHIRNSRDGIYEIVGVVGEVVTPAATPPGADMYVPWSRTSQHHGVMVKPRTDPGSWQQRRGSRVRAWIRPAGVRHVPLEDVGGTRSPQRRLQC